MCVTTTLLIGLSLFLYQLLILIALVKIPNLKQLKEGRTYFSDSLRSFYRSWWGRHGSWSTRLLAYDGQKKKWRTTCVIAQLVFSVLPWTLVQEPSPWAVVTHFQVRSCLLRHSAWKHSHRESCHCTDHLLI